MFRDTDQSMCSIIKSAAENIGLRGYIKKTSPAPELLRVAVKNVRAPSAKEKPKTFCELFVFFFSIIYIYAHIEYRV
jgi:hypothetical protein